MLVCKCPDDPGGVLFSPNCELHKHRAEPHAYSNAIEAERRMIVECLFGKRMFNMSGG